MSQIYNQAHLGLARGLQGHAANRVMFLFNNGAHEFAIVSFLPKDPRLQLSSTARMVE